MGGLIAERDQVQRPGMEQQQGQRYGRVGREDRQSAP
jgi:hypothetical protein